ncbi:hypothetical protein EVA_22193, partial [gut metagenome]
FIGKVITNTLTNKLIDVPYSATFKIID